MRTLSAQQQAILAETKRATHVRVRIDAGAGFTDMRTLQGWDWIESVDISASVDQPVADCTVKLARARDFFSLAPLDDTSRLNASGALVDLGNLFVVEVATTGDTVQPLSTDWVEIFRGKVDNVDWTSDPISFKGRDLGAYLQDTYIETQVKYPHDPDDFLPVEEIMQQILDDDPAAGAVVLYSENGSGGTPWNPSDSPGWDINAYVQQKAHIMDALQLLANQIGWDLRYRWQPTVGAFALVFSEPRRSITDADYTFASTFYFPPGKCSMDIANIRNRVVVTYGSGDSRTTYTATDAPSIAKYGRRTMEITEDASSQIDTITEATLFAEACRDDLKEPSLEWEVPVPFFWAVELGDYYQFNAGSVPGRHFSSDQKLGVVGYKHSLSKMNQVGKTTLQCRGKPAGGFARWINLEARLGYNPAVDHYQDNKPENVASGQDVGMLTISYDDPRSMSPAIKDWATTKVYIDTSSGFTPSDSNLVTAGRQTRFDIGGLVPGTTYYVKLQIIDSRGNVSSTSTQVAQATLKSGPYHENNEREFGVINPNPQFAVFSLAEANNPPDWWENVTNGGGWGNSQSNWYTQTANQISGGRSLVVHATDSSGNFTTVAGSHPREMRSKPFVVRPGFLYRAEWALYVNEDTQLQVCPVQIEWLDKDQASISTSSPNSTLNLALAGIYSDSDGVPAGTVNGWYKDRGWVKAPTTARYARVRLIVDGFASDASATLAFGFVTVTRAPVQANLSGAADDRSIAINTWVQPYLNFAPNGSTSIDNAGGFDRGHSSGGGHEHSYTIPISGKYQIHGRIDVTAAITAGKHLVAKLTKNGSDLVIGTPMTAVGVGEVATVFTGTDHFDAGDVIKLFGYQDDGAKTLDDSHCKLSIVQVGDEGDV